MKKSELSLVTQIWPAFYPLERLLTSDTRLDGIKMFQHFFLKNKSIFLCENRRKECRGEKLIHIDTLLMMKYFEYSDFLSTLQKQPIEVIGAIGIAISLIFSSPSSIINEQDSIMIIRPILYNFSPETTYDEIRSNTVGRFISIKGYVIRISLPKPLVICGFFICNKCGSLNSRYFSEGVYETPNSCHTSKCYSKSFDFVRSKAITTDYQIIKIQELDEDSKKQSSSVPRLLEVELHGGLVNTCIAGDIVHITGIVKTAVADMNRSYFKKNTGEAGVHSLFILANSMINSKSKQLFDTLDNESTTTNNNNANINNEDMSINMMNDMVNKDDIFLQEDVEHIQQIARHSNCLGILLASLCPSIYGHEKVKFGLLLSLFGGSSTVSNNSSSSSKGNSRYHLRSDIHMLIVGDPGLGKSQMIRAACDVSPRAVFVTANTTTTAGLTVAVQREGGGGEVSIEAGALVLADQGVCGIDEFDKMTADPNALLEAMEQQQISIAKSGIATSLKCRTTVIAAANPKSGKYKRGKTVSENLKMSSALISRFDLVFILLDRQDEQVDRDIANQILKTREGNSSGAGSHILNNNATTTQNPNKRSKVETNHDDNFDLSLTERLRQRMQHVETNNNSIHHELFRKYIRYAKLHIHPSLSPLAAKVLQKAYLKLRSESTLGVGVLVTTRLLENLIRLSQAKAKLELRDTVTEEDAEDVVTLVIDSTREAFSTEVGVIDFGRKNGTSITKQIKAVIGALTSESNHMNSTYFTTSQIDMICKRLQVRLDLSAVIEIMRNECYLLLKGPNTYQLNIT